MYPVLDKIVVKPIEEKSDSLIEIPDDLKRKPLKGKVIAAGPGTYEQPMSIKVDEIILYAPLSGIDVKINNEDYLIMKEADVLVRF